MMKYVSEYRAREPAKKLLSQIHGMVKNSWKIMEICGGQTHTILQFRLDELLPKSIELVHGPGCPVCVTPISWIDKAIEIAKNPEVIFCSFGDVLRVPGTREDLFSAKAKGAKIKIVYSPLDALQIAQANPQQQVVFFAVGFETTAPATAMAIVQAKKEKCKNFSVLVCHVRVPPAMQFLLSSCENTIQGFLAAGHVCTVMGYEEYESIASMFRVPIVVTGFEPVDLLEGILACVKQLEEGRYEVKNQYHRAVQRGGNKIAKDLLVEVFNVVSREWRGIGEIPQGGLDLSRQYCEFDAQNRFGKVQSLLTEKEKNPVCLSGLVLRGIKKPKECSFFGKECQPLHPLGATMVSAEGACAVYYRYDAERLKQESIPVLHG